LNGPDWQLTRSISAAVRRHGFCDQAAGGKTQVTAAIQRRPFLPSRRTKTALLPVIDGVVRVDPCSRPHHMPRRFDRLRGMESLLVFWTPAMDLGPDFAVATSRPMTCSNITCLAQRRSHCVAVDKIAELQGSLCAVQK